MDLPHKRKRVQIITIKNDSEDDIVEEISSDTNEDDYVPFPAKKKRKKGVANKEPKPKREPKPVQTKVVGIKVRSSKKKNVINVQDSDATVNVVSSLIQDEDNESIPQLAKSDAELEKAVTQAVEKAKEFCEPWHEEQVVAESCRVPVLFAKNAMKLFDQDCTIPFIVRYRKQLTGGIQAEKLREIQASYEEVKLVRKKVETILKTIKHEKFDETVAASFLCAKTLDEVELLYAPFKPGSRRTLAERSKQLGLEPLSVQLLEMTTSLSQIDLQSLMKPVKGLQTEEEILSSIQHIIADKISKDRRVLDFIREKKHHPQIRISSSKSPAAEKEDRKAHVEGKSTQNFKYENYYNLNILINNAAAHQIMALNRGEKQKVLTIKIQIPSTLKNEATRFIWDNFFFQKLEFRTYEFMKTCVADSYNRLIEPYLCRQIRSELSKKAEKEAINVFGSNVRSLLLTPPVRGKTIIGIDPGFAHGCKVACVSSEGKVLGTDVVYPHSKGSSRNKTSDEEKMVAMIFSHGAEIIGIGNGTACRETEVWLSNLIKSGVFNPHHVKYCIVNENGASIYSVTKEAEAEFPNMDPNLRSAVSIARRLQDPLLEYVKIEPKHLGVGMYQHDVAEIQLKKALDSIVEECVSFVGVDLNVCPEILLRKISGLSASKAKQIVEWRSKNSCFVNRQQLLEVKGLGQKSFEQCAGFVKILPETCKSAGPDCESKDVKKKKTALLYNNPLDRTIIHPESYDVAERFLKELKVDPENIGRQILVDKVTNHMKFTCVEEVATKLSVSVDVIRLVIDAFKQLQDYDIREEFEQPLFQTSVRSFNDLQTGQVLTGRVNNITGFGAFVDIGVGTNGLIHVSKMNGRKISVGDKVTVCVLEVNAPKKRIGLAIKL